MNEHAIFRKCAWRLLPLIMLAYVANYLDRTNVGFAALTMNRDLGFSPTVYGFGAGLLFVGYLLFQLPSSIVLEHFGTSRACSGILTVWGAVSASTALAHTPLSFYLARFVLGAVEAGFFPLMILYLTYWFPRSYRGRFTALFMTAIPLSAVVGGPMSGALLQSQNVGGLSGWQWLFVAEGLPAVVLGIAVFLFLPDKPASANWLTQSEKTQITARLSGEEVVRHRRVWPALRDPRVIGLGVANFAILFASNGANLWLPQIVQTIGYSTWVTSLLATLPSIASVPAMILLGRSSDRHKERIVHIAAAGLVGTLGFVLTAIGPSDLRSLAAITLAYVGLNAMMPMLFGLLADNLAGPAVAGGVALVLSVGNVGSFVGPTIIGILKERTGGFSAAMMIVAAVLLAAVGIVLAVGYSLQARRSTSAAARA